MEDIRAYEISYLLQYSVVEDSTDQGDDLNGLVKRGSYIEALRSSSCQDALSASGQRTEAIVPHLKAALNTYLECQSNEAQHTVLCIGICSLQLFVQSNFTGPASLCGLLELFPVLQKLKDIPETIKQEAMEYVAEDTEGVYSLLKNPEYFMLAKLVFCSLKSELAACLTLNWWSMRCDMVLQTVADEPSSIIYDRLQKSIIALQDCELINEHKELLVLFYLELGQAYLLYSDVRRAAPSFKKSDEVLKLNFELSGALGKRTKYQVIAKPQLVLQVKYDDQPLLAGEAEGPKLLSTDLPKDLQLNDDTRLPHYKFVEEDDDKVPSLTPIEQMAILVKLQHMRRSSAADLQLQEESKAYLNALLQYPKCWVIQYNCLLLRSTIESREPRAMDRSLQQLNELVECFTREEPSRFERLKLFYASNLPASWITKQKCGRLLIDLGCTKTALNHFEELELWEDVIDCYNRIQMRQRSEEIILRLLEKEETPKLYCLLGDATDKKEHYEKAWELSNKRSSRAQRSLGDYYFSRLDWKKAIEHYKASLKVCHIQVNVWAKLGFASLQTEDWKECSTAYRKCTVLEPDSFEYWNNLGKAQANLKDLPAALKCLKEAARLKSDSWKLFQNIMVTAAAINKLSDTLQAYRRLLVLQPKQVHIAVISKMVQIYLNDHDGEEGCERIYKQLSTFLSEMCNSCPSESEIWYCYGALASANPTPTNETRDLTFQHFRKSMMTLARGPRWYKEKETCLSVLRKVLKVVESLLNTVEFVSTETALLNARSLTMSLSNVMNLSKKGLTNVATGEIVEDSYDLLYDAESAVTRIDKLIISLTSEP